MDLVFSVLKNIDDFKEIESAPKDGRVIFIMDDFGHIDLAQWSLGDWSAEFGLCDEPTHWAPFSLATAPATGT